MSFYRTLLATVAAIAIASPVFADDTATTTQGTTESTPAAATQPTDNSAMQQQPSASTDQTQTQQTTATTAENKTNINKATAKELMKVKGVNAARARAIVAYRKKHGDFKSLDALSSVKGFKKVKPDTLKQIEDQLTVE